jgi:3-hydroxybutyryl-CoA dehydratase
MKVGQCASREVLISDSLVRKFAEVSGDCNPIHLDDEVAQGSIFGRRIAHGLLVASQISAVLAEQLPGPGTIYQLQHLEFVAPVFVGDRITAKVTVDEKVNRRKWKLSTDCSNSDGLLVLQGYAVVTV